MRERKLRANCSLYCTQRNAVEKLCWVEKMRIMYLNCRKMKRKTMYKCRKEVCYCDETHPNACAMSVLLYTLTALPVDTRHDGDGIPPNGDHASLS